MEASIWPTSPRAICVPDAYCPGQFDNDVLKPCERKISEEVKKINNEEDEERIEVVGAE